MGRQRHEVRYQGFERGKSAGGSGGAPATHRRGEAAGEEKLPAQLSSSEGHVQHGLRVHLGVQTSRQRRRVARVPNREVEHENQAADRALKEHKTDHATRRGLMALLNQRNKLLKYLFRTDRPAYTSTIESLGIRSRLVDEL